MAPDGRVVHLQEEPSPPGHSRVGLRHLDTRDDRNMEEPGHRVNLSLQNAVAGCEPELATFRLQSRTLHLTELKVMRRTRQLQ